MAPLDPPPQQPTAGWYPDPNGPGLRWWDGGLWTDHVHTDPVADDSRISLRSKGNGVEAGLFARWPLLVAGGIVVAVAALALSQHGRGRTTEGRPEPLSGSGVQPSPDANSGELAAKPSQSEHLSTGIASDVYWVREALADIHLACGGAREAEVAGAEMGVSGVGNGNVKRATEGAINQSVYGALVEEEDIDHLVRIYRAHPNARYEGGPMKLVMLDAAADLGNGSCDQPGAERIERELEFNSIP